MLINFTLDMMNRFGAENYFIFIAGLCVAMMLIRDILFYLEEKKKEGIRRYNNHQDSKKKHLTLIRLSASSFS